MEFLEEVTFMVEKQIAVSVNYIANELQLNVKRAIEVCHQFKDKMTDLQVNYLVIARDAGGSMLVTVVADHELVAYKKQHPCILCEQIYSIQQKTAESTRTHIVDGNLMQAEGLLNDTTAIQGSFLTNVQGDIIHPALEVRSVGDRIFSAQNVNFDASSTSVSAATAVAVVSSTMSTAGKLKTAAGITSSTSTVVATAATANVPTSATISKIQAKNAETAKSFFSNATATRPVKPLAQASLMKHTVTMPDPTAGPIGDVDEEWDDDQEGVVNKKKENKRKLVIDDDDEDDIAATATVVKQEEEAGKGGLSDDEKEGEEEDDEVENKLEGSPTKKKKARKANSNKKKVKADSTSSPAAPVKTAIHGAMDNYMEDIAIEEFKKNQAMEATNMAALLSGEALPMAGKKKKKVLVEKTFVDDQGYFVTEMVYDEVTDDEKETTGIKIAGMKPEKKLNSTTAAGGEDTDAIVKKENNENSKNSSSGSAAPASKGGKVSSGGATGKKGAAIGTSGPQKNNMMSFFTKKA